MLILRVVTRLHLSGKNVGCYLAPRHFASQAQPKAEIMDFKKQRLPAPLPKKAKREPFAKNLFLGKFDYEFLAYPEPQQVERYNEFQEWIEPLKKYMKSVNPKEFESTNEIPAHILQNLRELGIFGSRIPEDYKGVNLLVSEFMQVLETVSKVPALGFFFLKHTVPAIDILNKYGTVEQKLKYFPKIAAGHIQPTVALHEPTTGPVANDMQATAVLSDNDEYWHLDGEKTFVANSNYADIFLVFAHGMQSGTLEKRQEIISSFIVERDTEGLTVIDSPTNLLGLQGFNTSKIILKNVKIPKANIVGSVGDGAPQILNHFISNRHYVAGLTIPLLRNFMELLISDVLPRKYFDKDLHETVFAQRIISDINLVIYAIESVLYLTTGMIDIYEDQDVQLETSIVEQFCVQECLRVIHEAMWLVGPKACSLVAPFERVLRDAFTLTNYETLLYDTKIFSGLLGIGHYGLSTSDEIKKIRNPLQYPSFLFRKFFLTQRVNLHLDEYMHQSLRESAEFLDSCIYKLKFSAEQLLIRYGMEVTDQQVDLMRLSDMVSLIYATVAVAGRASRSYCIGNRDSEQEVKIALSLAHEYYTRVNKLAEEMEHGRYINGDYASQQIAVRNLETKRYYPAHPLQRNY